MTARSPWPRPDDRECAATMVSSSLANYGVNLHLHTCVGKHDEGEDHYCPKCNRRWFRGGP